MLLRVRVWLLLVFGREILEQCRGVCFVPKRAVPFPLTRSAGPPSPGARVTVRSLAHVCPDRATDCRGCCWTSSSSAGLAVLVTTEDTKGGE